MIENYLPVPVKNVKEQTLLGFLCVMLVGCNNAKGPVSFTPEMASFSNEFDFDPLHGLVKDFSQTLLNDKGKVARRVAGTLSQEGCFDTLGLYDTENSTGMALVLNVNYYRDTETLEKQIRLQGKCQPAELSVAGVVWDTDDNGLVVSATGKEMKVQYRYDAEGYPLGRTTVSEDNTLQVDAKLSANPSRKSGCTAVSLLDDHLLNNAKQACRYDEYTDPVNCQPVIVNESMRPVIEHHYSIENTIDYY